MKRHYVIASMKHVRNGYMQFWGKLTEDEEKRSYSGYTEDLNYCERYTKEELVNSHYGYKFYEDGMEFSEIFKGYEKIIFIKIEDIIKLGVKIRTTVWVG